MIKEGQIARAYVHTLSPFMVKFELNGNGLPARVWGNTFGLSVDSEVRVAVVGSTLEAYTFAGGGVLDHNYVGQDEPIATGGFAWVDVATVGPTCMFVAPVGGIVVIGFDLNTYCVDTPWHQMTAAVEVYNVTTSTMFLNPNVPLLTQFVLDVANLGENTGVRGPVTGLTAGQTYRARLKYGANTANKVRVRWRQMIVEAS